MESAMHPILPAWSAPTSTTTDSGRAGRHIHVAQCLSFIVCIACALVLRTWYQVKGKINQEIPAKTLSVFKKA